MKHYASTCAAVALAATLALPVHAQAPLPTVQNGPAGAPAAPFTPAPTPGNRAGVERFVQRFQAANTTHDGRLTLAQAQAGHMPGIVKNFAAIDQQHLGYVTLQDIRAWRQAHQPGGGQGGGNPAAEPSSLIVPDPAGAATHPYPTIAPLR